MDLLNALQAIKDRYTAILEEIATASQALDPETFGKTKAINAVVEQHAAATGNVIDQVWNHLATQPDEYVVAFVHSLRRKLKEADEVVNRWTVANVPTGDAAPKLSEEQEAQYRETLDKNIEMARVTRQLLVMNDPTLDDTLPAVPSKRRGARRGAGGKRMRAKFVWTVRSLDENGAVTGEEVVEGNTLSALGGSIGVSAADLRAAIDSATENGEAIDYSNPPSKLVFKVTSAKKGATFQVVGNKIETDEDDDDEPEAE